MPPFIVYHLAYKGLGDAPFATYKFPKRNLVEWLHYYFP